MYIHIYNYVSKQKTHKIPWHPLVIMALGTPQIPHKAAQCLQNPPKPSKADPNRPKPTQTDPPTRPRNRPPRPTRTHRPAKGFHSKIGQR